MKRLYGVFAKDGVDKEILQRYLSGTSSVAQGPKIVDARLDKFGLDVPTLMKSAWNRALIKLFAQEAAKVANQFQDGRFDVDDYDWEALFKKRIYSVLKDEINGRRKTGETHEERVFRLVTEYDQNKKQKGVTALRNIVRAMNFLSVGANFPSVETQNTIGNRNNHDPCQH